MFIVVFLLCVLPFFVGARTSILNSDVSILNNEKSIISENSPISGSKGLLDNSKSIISADNSILKNVSLLDKGKNIISLAEGFVAYGSYMPSSTSTMLNTVADSKYVVKLTSEQESVVSSYLGEYDKYVALTLSNDTKQFVKLLTDWEKSKSNEDFYSFVESSDAYANMLDEVLKTASRRFAIGTAVILFDVVLYSIPGGTLYRAIVVIPLRAALKASSAGLISGAMYGAIASAAQGNDAKTVFVKSLDAASDGYMIGALAGTVKGWGSAISKYRCATVVTKDRIVLKNGNLVDDKGKVIGKAIYSPEGRPVSYTVNGRDIYTFEGSKIGTLSTNYGYPFIIDNNELVVGAIDRNGYYDGLDNQTITTYSPSTWVGKNENKYIALAEDTLDGLDDVKAALSKYSYDNSSSINALMQGYTDTTYSIYVGNHAWDIHPELYDQYQRILYATTSTIVPENLIVYRGMSSSGYRRLKAAGYNGSFLSTSITGIPSDWKDSDVMMQLIIPERTKGIYIDHISVYGGRDERELLLPPDYRIKILSEDMQGSKTYVTAILDSII
ncbi:MAG: ADP-ribosyltransferase [Candidatus Dojkabacteria bacterium]|nr:ADP-ribosyltransferase [Candidatus Dojkabacteria bacterium]